jgi:hypothetical protein
MNVSLLAALVVMLLTAGQATAGQQWFSAWTAAPSFVVATAMNGTSVRMIVRPTISGSAVRVKLENRFGKSAIVFSAAYTGQVQSGAALTTGSNTPLTFNGKPGLTLAAGAGAYSDPVTFQIAAFTRYAISLDVTTASEISAHYLGLVTNYSAMGAHAVDSAGTAFNPVPQESDPSRGRGVPVLLGYSPRCGIFFEYGHRRGLGRFNHRRLLQHAHKQRRL